MRDIYSQAPRLPIWLGDAVVSDAEAIDAVFRLMRHIFGAEVLGERGAIRNFGSESFVRSRLSEILKVHNSMSQN